MTSKVGWRKSKTMPSWRRKLWKEVFLTCHLSIPMKWWWIETCHWKCMLHQCWKSAQRWIWWITMMNSVLVLAQKKKNKSKPVRLWSVLLLLEKQRKRLHLRRWWWRGKYKTGHLKMISTSIKFDKFKLRNKHLKSSSKHLSTWRLITITIRASILTLTLSQRTHFGLNMPIILSLAFRNPLIGQTFNARRPQRELINV